MRMIAALIALGAVLVPASALTTASAAPPGAKVVMSGLDNPRGLAITGGGRDDDDDHDHRGGTTIYVAEAGEGGQGPCVPTGDPGRPIACYGPTGAISILRHGRQRRLVTGMPSNAQPGSGGNDATGPHDISLRGGKFVAIGMGAPPANRPGFGLGGRDFAKVVRLQGNGWRPVADIAAHEAVANPDNGESYTNPYGLLQTPSGRLLIDAGGNSLLRFRANGTISTVAVFPSRPQGRPTDSVPTSVVRGPDRRLYVGELSGVPFAPGTANIYRVTGNTATIWQSGFTTIMDMAFACDRTLYVLQHSSLAPFFGGPGEVVRVEPNGSRTTAFTGLQRPTSIAFGPDGKLYISNLGNMRDVGEVLRVDVGESCRHFGDEDDD